MKLCERCNEEHDGKFGSGRFCSNYCAHSFSTHAKRLEINDKVSRKLRRNPIVIKLIKEKVERLPKICLNCGTDRLSYKAKKYCSNKCQGAYRRKKVFESIENGTHAYKDPKAYRKYFLFTYGNCCTICKLTEWLGQKIPLVLDHIDGNSENWLISNLRLICPNCDAQLPTYKSKNKGKGRHARRQRYKEGKSY